MTTLLVADGQYPKIRELLVEALVPLLWLEGEQHPLEAVTTALGKPWATWGSVAR